MKPKLRRFAAVAGLAAVVAGAAFGCKQATHTPQVIYITPEPGSAQTPSPSPTLEPSPSLAPSPTPVPAAATVTFVKVTRTGSTGSCHDWKATIKKPVVGGPAEDAAAAMNAAIDAKVQGAIESFKTEMGYGGGGAGPCTLTGEYSIALSTTRLLSLRLTFTQYTGGASSSAIAGSVNFTTTGKVLALADLFTDPAAAAAKLSTESRTRLLAQLSKDGVDAGWVNPGTEPAMASFDSAWAFTVAGLELTFEEITVAPHALGTPTIVIPWASLAGVLDPAGPAGEFIP
jgi:hypothetical protein